MVTGWQRPVRLAIALFGIGFTIVVYFALRSRETPTAPAPIVRSDATAVIESTGAQVWQFKGAQQDLRVESDRQLGYSDGSAKLFGARIFVDERANRNFRLTANEAHVGKGNDQLQVMGNVRLSVSDGLEGKAQSATYSQAEGIVRAPGPVEFAKGKMSGAAVGLTYDKNRDVLWLLEQAKVTLASDQPGVIGSEMTAGAAGLARRDKYARFETNVRMTRGSQVAESDNATIFLSPDEQRIELVQLRGHARLGSTSTGAGSLRGMHGDDINVEYAKDSDSIQRAVMSNNASIEIAGTAGGVRRIVARFMDVTMAPDGTTVMALNARENVRLDLPAEQDTPARVICSASLAVSGEAGKGLTLARFRENVEYREAKPGTKPAPATLAACAGPGGPKGQAGDGSRVAKASALDLTFQAGLGAVTDGTFTGAVQFQENQLTAAARQARYVVDGGSVELEGVHEQTSLPPQVTDGQTDITATHIEITLDGRKITAEKDVRTALRPAAPGAKAGATVPAMLKKDQLVLAVGDSLAYDGEAGRAVYTGGARLWQGETAIRANRIELDDKKGDLAASGSVVSHQMLEQRNEATKVLERVNTIASAEELVFDNAVRRATYKTKARVTGPQGDLSADTIEMYLTPSGNSLDRLEAYGNVVLRGDVRSADGDRLTYFAAEEKYEMTGKVVHLCAESRETTGKLLTFFKSTDTIKMDGNEETRTRTIGGGKCSKP